MSILLRFFNKVVLKKSISLNRSLILLSSTMEISSSTYQTSPLWEFSMALEWTCAINFWLTRPSKEFYKALLAMLSKLELHLINMEHIIWEILPTAMKEMLDNGIIKFAVNLAGSSLLLRVTPWEAPFWTWNTGLLGVLDHTPSVCILTKMLPITD